MAPGARILIFCHFYQISSKVHESPGLRGKTVMFQLLHLIPWLSAQDQEEQEEGRQARGDIQQGEAGPEEEKNEG